MVGCGHKSSSFSLYPSCNTVLYCFRKVLMDIVGCRAGAQCRYAHPDPDRLAKEANDTTAAHNTTDHGLTQGDALPTRPIPQVVHRPMPQAQTHDPKAFQVGQIQRRFKPDVSQHAEASTYSFQMKPTDPDFPYDIDHLECILTVPDTFPASGRPSLKVVNNDIPRGFQINIERGFTSIVADAPNVTLLALMNRLDRQLEVILSGKMAETIKLVSNRGVASERPRPEEPQQVSPVSSQEPDMTTQTRVFTADEKAAARQRRAAHTRQLEARFSRLPLFAKSADGSTFTLPLDAPKKYSWPSVLQELRTFRLHVSEEYPLAPATLLLDSDATEARAVEKAYEEWSSKAPDLTLTSQINYLLQHIPEMAAKHVKQTATPAATAVVPSELMVNDLAQVVGNSKATTHVVDQDRPHIHIVPRPPEWGLSDNASDDSDSGSDYDTSPSESEDDPEKPNPDGNSEQANIVGPSGPVEKGVLLSFPHLELHGVELLELVSLDITIKCERCKDTMDVRKLRNYNGEVANMRNETCKKCATGFGVGFRTDLIHANSVRAGYLDLDGCNVIDMLPR